jgi:hypothetical protein
VSQTRSGHCEVKLAIDSRPAMHSLYQARYPSSRNRQGSRIRNFNSSFNPHSPARCPKSHRKHLTPSTLSSTVPLAGTSPSVSAVHYHQIGEIMIMIMIIIIIITREMSLVTGARLSCIPLHDRPMGSPSFPPFTIRVAFSSDRHSAF